MARRPFAVLSALVPLSLLVLTAAPSGAAETTTPRPDDAHVLALAEGDAYNSRCSVHISTDAGLTWNTTTAPEVPDEWPGCMFATTGTIADVAFAGDGTLYFAFTGFDPRTYHQRTFLARSDDLGQRWDTVELPWVEPDPATGQSGADGLPSVVVDPDDPERVYVGWWSNNGTWNLPEGLSGGKEWCDDLIPRPWVATSSDGGRSFSGAVDLAPGVEGCMTEPYLLAGNDGELFAYFGESAFVDGEEAENGFQDIYATRVRFSDPATVFSTEAAGTGISVAAVLLGAAGALVLGGLALVVVTSTRRRSGDAS